MLASRVIGFVSLGAYPVLPNTPIPRSGCPLLNSWAVASESPFTKRYCEKFPIVAQLLGLKLIGRPWAEALPSRTPTACKLAADDNGPNGEPTSLFGLVVQVPCAQLWPGSLPILYEKTDAP